MSGGANDRVDKCTVFPARVEVSVLGLRGTSRRRALAFDATSCLCFVSQGDLQNSTRTDTSPRYLSVLIDIVVESSSCRLDLSSACSAQLSYAINSAVHVVKCQLALLLSRLPSFNQSIISFRSKNNYNNALCPEKNNSLNIKVTVGQRSNC